MSTGIITCQQFGGPEGVAHGFFSRGGGVSPSPWDSLNVSYGVGDEPERVAENRRIILRELGLTTLVAARQVHGDRVVVVGEHSGDQGGAVPQSDYVPLNRQHTAPGERLPVPPTFMSASGHDEWLQCDALISAAPGVGLLIQQADCQAVLLHDPRRRVVANIHAGWRGSVANIIGKTVATMRTTFGCRPAELTAAISPSLGPCCAEFVNHERELPAAFRRYQVRPNYFDFWAISIAQLQAAGVPAVRIEKAGICSRCNPATCFSYRRDLQCGRNATVIGLLS